MGNKIIPYRSDLKDRARFLRSNLTEAESHLWTDIRKKALGVEFHRQVPLLDYIVDFYCHENGIVIEVDGTIHDSQFLEDAHRQGRLEAFGLNFLRFTNQEALEEIESVLEKIQLMIKELS